jgi:hypothetical protein
MTIVQMKPVLAHASEYSQSQVKEPNDSLLALFGQIVHLERWHLTMHTVLLSLNMAVLLHGLQYVAYGAK